MNTKTDNQQLTKPAQTGVASFDYGEAAGGGFENVGKDDMIVPWLTLLQSNSPQVEDEGLTAGQFYNTVTKAVAANINFLPVHIEQAFVEWVPRTKGGGFVGLHAPNSQEVQGAIEDNGGSKFGSLKIGENDLTETKYVYGLVLNEKGDEAEGFAVISFKKTAIQPFKSWVTAMRTLLVGPPGQRKPVPLFANRARLGSVKQKNEKGSFFNFAIAPLANGWKESLVDPSSELFAEALKFREMVVGGLARADFSKERVAGDSPDAGGDEAPF